MPLLQLDWIIWIVSYMKKQHWLPVESRIQFKGLVLLHACVHNIAPPYLSNLLTSYVPSSEMRSSGQLILHQPIPTMVTYGKRSFAYSGPRLWNSLEKHLGKIVTSQAFEHKFLKHIHVDLHIHFKYILFVMYMYMLLPFDVEIIYLLDVNKCIHLVGSGTYSTS